jgi:excisionase family DNA binding protein/PAS domain S-box-containing protein
MNLKTAARRLGVHYQTAYRLVQQGDLTAVKIGNRYEISEEAIERAVARPAALARYGDPYSDARNHDGSAISASRTRDEVLQDLDVVLATPSVEARPALGLIARTVADCLGDTAFIIQFSSQGEVVLPAVCETSESSLVSFASTLCSALVSGVGAGLVELASKEARVVRHIRQDQLYSEVRPEYHECIRGLALHTMIVVPMVAADELLGVFLSFRGQSPAPYTCDDLEFVKAIARRCARAIRTSRECRAGWAERARLRGAIYAEMSSRPSVGADPYCRWTPRIPDSEFIVAFTGADGGVTAVNRQFLEVTGYAEADVVGRRLSDLIVPARADRRPDGYGYARSEFDCSDSVCLETLADGDVMEFLVNDCNVYFPGESLCVVVSVLIPTSPA